MSTGAFWHTVVHTMHASWAYLCPPLSYISFGMHGYKKKANKYKEKIQILCLIRDHWGEPERALHWQVDGTYVLFTDSYKKTRITYNCFHIKLIHTFITRAIMGMFSWRIPYFSCILTDC